MARENLSGWGEDGNYQVITDGRQSTTKVQRSFPSCTVTVYDYNTVTLASIMSDLAGTPKANPFTADEQGRWDFWADPGRYDVQFSESGIPTPFARVALWVAEGGGTGTLEFFVTADAGTPQTIVDQDTLTIAGGDGVVTTVGAVNTVTVDVDLAPAQNGVPNAAEFIATQLYVTPRDIVTNVTVINNYTIITATDNVILVDTSGGDVTITLATPAADDPRTFHIKKITTDFNSVILDPVDGLIDNAATVSYNGVIGLSGESRYVFWDTDALTWWIL